VLSFFFCCARSRIFTFYLQQFSTTTTSFTQRARRSHRVDILTLAYSRYYTHTHGDEYKRPSFNRLRLSPIRRILVHINTYTTVRGSTAINAIAANRYFSTLTCTTVHAQNYTVRFIYYTYPYIYIYMFI